MYVHQVMGVCCIVFDIDGMLFEFFMNFFNIEKFNIFCFPNFMFSSRFMLFPTFKKKLCQKNVGGGGGVKKYIFFRKQFFLISRFILFSTLQNNNIEKFPFTYCLNGAISNI